MILRKLLSLCLLITAQCQAENWTPADTIRLFQELLQDQQPIPAPPAGPIILWSGLGPEPQPAEVIHLLRKQGFNQHLPLIGEHKAAAKALAQQGAPIQIIQGLKSFPVTDDDGKTVHLPSNMADGFNLRSWRHISNLIRDTLESYRKKDLQVDALWLDYEGAPFMAMRHEVARQSLTLDLPLHLDAQSWAQWRRQFALNTLSTYIAAPAREVFPHISILNWAANVSYPDTPITNALGNPTPASGPLFFTHTNPYAYGNTISYEAAGLPLGLPQAEVDEFYRNLLLRHTSRDAQNRMASAPNLGAVAWVARVVKDSTNPGIPLMSRETYRETLRHLWLRGLQGMMVFNSPKLTHNEHEAEIRDVATIWREMSSFNGIIRNGKPANLSLQLQNGCLWSALHDSNQAVLRITPIGQPVLDGLELPIWPDMTVVMSTPEKPQTYKVWRNPALVDGYMISPSP